MGRVLGVLAGATPKWAHMYKDLAKEYWTMMLSSVSLKSKSVSLESWEIT